MSESAAVIADHLAKHEWVPLSGKDFFQSGAISRQHGALVRFFAGRKGRTVATIYGHDGAAIFSVESKDPFRLLMAMADVMARHTMH